MAEEIECLRQRIGRNGNALGAADIDDLGDAGKEDRLDVRIIPEFADRQARRRRDAGIGGEWNELHPELGFDLLAQGSVKAGLLTQREEVLGPFAALAIEFAEDHDDWIDLGEFPIAGFSESQRVFGLRDEVIVDAVH